MQHKVCYDFCIRVSADTTDRSVSFSSLKTSVHCVFEGLSQGSCQSFVKTSCDVSDELEFSGLQIEIACLK